MGSKKENKDSLAFCNDFHNTTFSKREYDLENAKPITLSVQDKTFREPFILTGLIIMSNFSTNPCDIAGEFYVAAELSKKGYIASATLGSTKGVEE